MKNKISKFGNFELEMPELAKLLDKLPFNEMYKYFEEKRTEYFNKWKMYDSWLKSVDKNIKKEEFKKKKFVVVGYKNRKPSVYHFK